MGATAIHQQQNTFANLQRLKNTSVVERLAKIRSIEKYLTNEKRKKELTAALFSDLRKPEEESVINELVPVLMNIKHIMKYLREWMRDEYVKSPVSMAGLSSYIKYEPKGSILIISPWNYPFQLAVNPLLYAIAAGNAVIIKPSEMAPATSAFLREMVENIFNSSDVAVVEGDAQIGNELIQLPFHHIFFTGSAAVGKIVMQSAAKNLTSVTLELGGKSPAVVDESYDIKKAARMIAWGKTMNNGQTCIAPDYVLIHESKKETFFSYYREAVESFYNSDKQGIENSRYLARMVNEKHFNRVKNLLDNAVSKGAKVVSGGITNIDNLYIEPTVLDQVDLGMQIMQEEIFGPVLPVLTFSTIDEAIQKINTLPKPLAFYILSNKKSNINFILNNTSAGGTCINELMLGTVNQYLPFGGINNSGQGKSNGKYSFMEFSNARGIIKRKWGTLRMLYPPYNKTIVKWLTKISRI